MTTTMRVPKKRYLLEHPRQKILWAAAMNVLKVGQGQKYAVFLGDEDVTQDCLWLSARGFLTLNMFEITPFGRTYL